ncbi:hypothetical protein RhiXN_08431 [Rhizoctonia solani]|uniref:Uncharacterized protein n=1 Tax=Rhizoctonia solani TaxID=456999 RepID=A0A8H8P1A2_9AGAM|nr:uncharacterized protein RhiXN_08431 [Rhizoctonia solani]QRW23395.1 hypothetical protein RhiXN_08431 [Rhizoctonia solani]
MHLIKASRRPAPHSHDTDQAALSTIAEQFNGGNHQQFATATSNLLKQCEAQPSKCTGFSAPGVEVKTQEAATAATTNSEDPAVVELLDEADCPGHGHDQSYPSPSFGPTPLSPATSTLKKLSDINHVLVGRINNLEEHIARIEEPGLSFAERLNNIYEADLQEQRNLITNLEAHNRNLALTIEEQERLIEERDRLLVEKELELDNFHCSIQDITQDGKGRIHYYKEYEFFAVSYDNAWLGRNGRD